jgi:AraC-like DNA-binding protein
MLNRANEFFRYLSVGERDRKWGLYVTGGGFNAVEPGSHYPRPGHPRTYLFSWSKGRVLSEYQMLFITQGEGEFESHSTGGKKVPSGSVVLLFPGVWHRYRPVAAVGWHEYWVSYSGDCVDRLVEHGFFSPREPILKVGGDDALLHAYLTLLDRLRSEPIGFQQLLAASVMEILAALMGAVRAQGAGSRMHEIVCRAKSLLESHTGATPTIEKLANSLGLSARQLYRVFREHTGLSPHQYHLLLRIERAKRMLHGTSMSVKEVAAALAFENPFHFSNVFKQKTGTSPTQWRRSGSAVTE